MYISYSQWFLSLSQLCNWTPLLIVSGKMPSPIKSNKLQNNFSKPNNYHRSFLLYLTDLMRHLILFSNPPLYAYYHFPEPDFISSSPNCPTYLPVCIIIYCPLWPHHILKYFHHYDTLVLINFLYHLIQTLHLLLQSWSNWSYPLLSHYSLIWVHL